VREQWSARLPEQKKRLFDSVVETLEVSYMMGSVALDQALALRGQGALIHAREETAMAGELIERLAERLLAALGALAEHGRHLGPLPDVLPLNADFFRGELARHIAEWNSLMHHVLLSTRSRFFHKVRSLDDAVEGLAHEFRLTADEIAEGTSVHPESHWASLDALHFDLNTCLRETIVVLKSFLCRLPAEQVEEFERQLAAQHQALQMFRQTSAGRGGRTRPSRAST